MGIVATVVLLGCLTMLLITAEARAWINRRWGRWEALGELSMRLAASEEVNQAFRVVMDKYVADEKMPPWYVRFMEKLTGVKKHAKREH